MTEGAACVFCGRLKEGGWKSDIAVLLYGKPLDVVTVCPKCRGNHTIQEIYLAVTRARLDELKALIESQKGAK